MAKYTVVEIKITVTGDDFTDAEVDEIGDALCWDTSFEDIAKQAISAKIGEDAAKRFTVTVTD